MRDRRETSHFAKELPPTPEGASHFAKELRGTGRGTDPTSLYDEQLRGAGRPGRLIFTYLTLTNICCEFALPERKLNSQQGLHDNS